MFSSVVFPAPLGPIIETISPRLTSRLTRPIAWTPPKYLETSWTLSSASVVMRVPRALHTRCCPYHASLARRRLGHNNNSARLYKSYPIKTEGVLYRAPAALSRGKLTAPSAQAHVTHAPSRLLERGHLCVTRSGLPAFFCQPCAGYVRPKGLSHSYTVFYTPLDYPPFLR